MANVNLKNFPKATTIQSSDLIHISQGGIDKGIEASILLEGLEGGVPNNLTIKDESGTSRYLLGADKQSYITCLNASTTTLTLFSEEDAGWNLGDLIYVRKGGAGDVAISPDTGVVINTNIVISAEGQVGYLIYKGGDVWDLVTGGGVSTSIQGAITFASVSSMIAKTIIDGSTVSNWVDYLGNNVNTVVNNSTSKTGGATYQIKTLVQAASDGDVVNGNGAPDYLGANHPLDATYCAILKDKLTPDNCGYRVGSVSESIQLMAAASKEVDFPADNLSYESLAQNTSYTMPVNRYVFGEEYLWGFHKYVFDNNNNANCKFIWSGDSTTAGDNAGGYTPSFIGSLVSSDLGLARHQHINSGHSGKAATDWDSLYVGQDIVNHPDMNVYVARWGINDGFWHNNVETYIEAMDSALTNLRIFKSVEDLAIVVVSPNSTFDDPTNRGTAWYESIIPELRKICRKHQAMFVDIYAIWQDAKQGALNTGSSSTGKRWLDNPYGDGRGIHPDAAFACQIGLRITELIVKPALVKSNIKNNMVANIHPDQFRPLANVQPANYPRFMGCYTVNQSDGWPFDGKLRTTRNGSKVIQELFITTAEDTTEVGNVIPKKKVVRFGDVTAGLWSKWYNRAVAPGLVGGWTQHNSQVQKYVHREDGLCTIEGSVENGTDGNPIFSIPVEMRPTSNKTFITLSSAGFYGIVTVQTDGNVIASKNGGTFCGLDGVVWTAGD